MGLDHSYANACDICHEKTWTRVHNLKKCVYCKRMICPQCSVHGFCNEDYALLSLDDRMKLTQIKQKYANKRQGKKFTALSIVTFAGLGLSILLWMLAETNPVLILVAGFLEIILDKKGDISRESDNDLEEREYQAIAIRYQLKIRIERPAPAPVGQGRSMPPMQIIPPIIERRVELKPPASPLRWCANCLNDLPTESTYCDRCGESFLS